MRIMWLEDAISDLQSLHLYITRENPSVAKRVAKQLFDAVNLLIEQPGIGRQGRVHNTRELIVTGTPYVIPYRVKDKNIEILRVFHHARQWPEEI